MENTDFDRLLLHTAFSCMACDGDIDMREVKLIKELHRLNNTFGAIDIEVEMNKLLISINRDGHQFLKEYFEELTNSDLSEANELKLIEVAIETIKADEKVEYSEIKFFKVIRSKLKIGNDPILEIHPDFEEYLEQDIITASYLARLQEDFFDTHSTTEFNLSTKIDADAMKDLTEEDE